MNWNLISKDKSGETHVSFVWVCVLIVFVGFLFGSGFTSAYYLIQTIMGGMGK